MLYLYLQLLFYILFFISVFSFISLAPRVPTRNKDLKRINDIIKLKPWEKFLEIWCGTAKVSIFIAIQNPKSEILWIELSPFLFLVSYLKVKISKQKNIKIIYGNALKIDFKDYDILYVFWLPETIKNKLFSKLKNEMKKTASFVSYCFKMENDYFIEEKYKPLKENSIYVYKII